MLSLSDDIHISTKKLGSILRDAKKTATAINLIYVDDRQPGIARIRKKETFHYYADGEKIRDEIIIERIKKLAIPPAWENVWICLSDNGHLQATGIDLRQRKQYKYHALWNSLRNHTKFYRLHEFGKAIPSIRQQLQHDLALKGLPVGKVLALVVSLMEQTNIRIGNSAYEKIYGSFGLTTLKDKHVKISGNRMQFVFKGKKGITHNISVRSKRLAKIVKSCREIPGKELFQYYDEEGNHKSIDSGMVNNYIKAISGSDFTAKDFRTWAGTVHSLTAFRQIGKAETIGDTKKNILAVLDDVAARLGNTRNVCKKYYVHPAIIDLYENDKLHSYLENMDIIEDDSEIAEEEKILLTILEKEGLVTTAV
jgi:DNA topoisomerase-1